MLMSFLLFCGAALAAEYVYSASVEGEISLYISPDDESHVITKIPACSRLKLLETERTWGLVEFNNKAGWINLSFTRANYSKAAEATGNDFTKSVQVKAKDTKAVLYNVPSDDIRLGSSEKYSIPNNTVLKITRQTDSGWGLVSMHGKYAWIKMSENDKSVDFGIECPIGSWLIATKVDNDEVWERIKKGELKGFSIEAFVNLEELNLNQISRMSKEKLESIEVSPSFWDKLKSIIAEALGKPQEEQPTPEEVVEEIAEEVAVEEEPVVEMAEEQPEEPKVEEIVEEVVVAVEETTETPEDGVKELEAIIEQLKETIAEKEAEIEELKKANQKLSRQPSVKPVKMTCETKPNPRDVIEKLKAGTYFNK